MSSKPITIQPLTPVIGAEVQGIDLSQPLDDEGYQRVHDALLLHQVIFLRDQTLDLGQLEAFGRRFGELHLHPMQSSVEGHPGLIKVHVDATSEVYAGKMWHSDVSSDPEPPMGSILHLHEVPPTGGDTLFSSMYAAFDGLSTPMKEWLSGLEALHETRQNMIRAYGAKAEELREDVYPEAVHPVVCTHLYRHIASPKFQCRFAWRKNSIAFWDNRCVQYLAIWDYYPHTRSGHRVTLVGPVLLTQRHLNAEFGGEFTQLVIGRLGELDTISPIRLCS